MYNNKLKVNGYSLSWTLGFLINNLHRNDFLPYEKVETPLISKNVFIPVVVTSAIVAIIITIFLLIKYAYKIFKEDSKGNHQQLSTNE